MQQLFRDINRIVLGVRVHATNVDQCGIVLCGIRRLIMKAKSKGVRVSEDLWKQLQILAESTRPKSTLQYVLEDAVEQYLKEKGVEYAAREHDKKH
jgi:predicted DNA-binding protein